MVSIFYWWGWMESNHLPSGYEPPALTDELQPRPLDIIAYYHLVSYNWATNIMPKINIRRIYYHIRHRYVTPNNLVIAVAFVIGLGWAWGSVGVMQRNFDLQKEIDHKQRQQLLLDLETENLAYQQNYYKTAEYQELAARERLGLGMAGEKVLILPPNSEAATRADSDLRQQSTVAEKPPTNLTQWMNFLFGGNRRGLQS